MQRDRDLVRASGKASMINLGEIRDQVTTYNSEAERQLLALFIACPAEFAIEISSTHPEDFGSARYEIIFSTLREMLDRGDPVSFVSLFHFMQERQIFDRIGGIAGYLDMWNCVIFGGNGFPKWARQHMEFYLAIVRRYKRIRDSQQAMEETVKQLADADVNEKELIQSQISQLVAIARDQEETLVSSEQVFHKIRERLEGPKDFGDEIKTGFLQLDSEIGGLRKKALTVVGARTKVGKTCFLASLFDNIFPKYKTLIFSIEMEMFDIVTRIVSRHSVASSVFETEFIRQAEIARNTIPPERRKRFWSLLFEICNKEWWIDDGRPLFIEAVKTKARMIKNTSGLDVIMIDYLQRVRSRAPEHRNKQLYQIIGDIGKGLVDLAQELDVAIVAPAQINRIVTPFDRPSPEHLRESGDIEQDAALLLLLWLDPTERDASGKPISWQHKITIGASRYSKQDLDLDIHFKPEYTGFF